MYKVGKLQGYIIQLRGLQPSGQFSSVVQSCPTLCDPMDCSMPGLLVHQLHQIPEFTETHVHWVSDAIQPSHCCCPLLLPPSIFPRIRVLFFVFFFQMSQFFESGGQSLGGAGSASVLPMNIQDWFLLGWTGWISCSPRGSQESSPTPQFKNINSSALSFLYSPNLTSIHDFVGKVMSLLFNMLSKLVITFLPRSVF